MTAVARRCWCGRPIPATSAAAEVECAEHDDPPAARHVEIALSKPDAGCTARDCGDPRTVLIDGHRGRRCPDHATLPEGPFRADLAADMVELGRADAAFTYLGVWLAAECDRRFDAAIGQAA